MVSYDQLSILDTISERPPVPDPSPYGGRSRFSDMIHSGMSEKCFWSPTPRRAAAVIAIDEYSDKTRKKKKFTLGRRAPNKDTISDEEHERFVDQLWELVQLGLHVGNDDTSIPDGILSATPDEILLSKIPLKLRPYQKHAINRILDMFLHNHDGALLAFGMGLGKTLIIIGMCPPLGGSGLSKTNKPTVIIVFMNKNPNMFQFDWIHHINKGFDPQDDVQGHTLIVVPKGLIALWKDEIENRTFPMLRVVIYRE